MRSSTRPLIVNRMGTAEQSSIGLEPLTLERGSGSGSYDESWIQDLIDRNPSVLPIDDIEPGLVDARAVCRELAMPSGFLDNLLMTPEGGLVVVEAKLWRNPQARREVVGQVLDYAKDLSRWGYEDLERAVRSRRRETASLYELVCGPDPAPENEARFVDSVSRNLRLGRFLCLIVGDGIQESAELLADFLQRHVGLHFTLAMVELSLWRLPTDGAVLVQPRLITRTVQIERAVVRLEGRGEVLPAPAPSMAATARTSVTLTEEQFYEALARVEPGLPERVRSFAESLEPLGVRSDFRKTLSLKWRSSDGRDFHLGVIATEGFVYFDYCNWSADSISRLDLSHAYLDAVASMLPGGRVNHTPKPAGWNIRQGAGWPMIGELLNHEERWRVLISDYLDALRETLDLQS